MMTSMGDLRMRAAGKGRVPSRFTFSQRDDDEREETYGNWSECFGVIYLYWFLLHRDA